MKKIIISIIVLSLITTGVIVLFKKKKSSYKGQEIYAKRSSIAIEFRETGSVGPRTRLEIRPQVSGRIEDILVIEGQKVKKGEILAWMSSTDRAALLDATRSQNKEEIKKFEDVYKPTSIVAPLNGFIIIRNKEPGQTVTVSDSIVVMADTLIIAANVDETDLRYIKLGQKVKIFLDAYPDKYFNGIVEHIAYESKVINNVTVYEIKIKPENPPQNFRSGMTATIELKAEQKDDVLLLPVNAVISNNNEKYVLIKKGKSEKAERRKIVTGINDGKNIEIVSGITEEDTILLPGASNNSTGGSSRTRGGSMGGIFGGGRR